MSNDNKRFTRLQNVIESWKKSDPNATLKDVQSTDLDSEYYQGLVRRLEN